MMSHLKVRRALTLAVRAPSVADIPHPIPGHARGARPNVCRKKSLTDEASHMSTWRQSRPHTASTMGLTQEGGDEDLVIRNPTRSQKIPQYGFQLARQSSPFPPPQVFPSTGP